MNRKRIGWLSEAAVVLATFVIAISIGAVRNNEHNPGAKVAEAAGRVDRQVDDTQAFDRKTIPAMASVSRHPGMMRNPEGCIGGPGRRLLSSAVESGYLRSSVDDLSSICPANQGL